jgi:hypothetical protein
MILKPPSPFTAAVAWNINIARSSFFKLRPRLISITWLYWSAAHGRVSCSTRKFSLSYGTLKPAPVALLFLLRFWGFDTLTVHHCSQFPGVTGSIITFVQISYLLSSETKKPTVSHTTPRTHRWRSSAVGLQAVLGNL